MRKNDRIRTIALLGIAAVMTFSTACAPGTAESISTEATTAASADSTAAEDSSESSGNRLEEIKERGTLTIATEPYFAPYEFIDSSKQGQEQYVGADIELAKYIADKMGVELQIDPLEFSAVITSVVEGKDDLAISGLAYTEERAEAVNLSDGYYTDPTSDKHGLLIRTEDEDKIHNLEDLADKTIVYQAGSLQEALVKASGATFKEEKKTSSSNDAYLTVQEGRADAAAVNIGSAELYAEANGGLEIVKDFQFDMPEEMAGAHIGIMKGEDELTDFVNQCIAEVKESGQMSQWVKDAQEYAVSLGVN